MLFLCLWLVGRHDREVRPVAPPTDSLLARSDTSMPPPPVIEARQETVRAASRLMPSRIPYAGKPYDETLPGKVDSWADWNGLFSDTSTHSCSVVFDGARIELLPERRIIFVAMNSPRENLVVKRVFCRANAVSELTKYTFPGESVDFSVKPGFVGSVFLQGQLRPQEGKYPLRIEMVQSLGSGNSTNAQFIASLKSPRGYSYSLQLGFECWIEGVKGSDRVYYSPPLEVGFPRMTSYTSLLSGAGDTVLIVSNNARAIVEISKKLPQSTILAAFIPVDDESEAEAVHPEAYPNLRLHVSTPEVIDESFLLLDRSRALVEERYLDPEFKRMALLCLKEDQMERIGYPRTTRLVRSKSYVERLRSKYQQYLRR